MNPVQTIVDEAPDGTSSHPAVLDVAVTIGGGKRCMGPPAKAKRKPIGGPFDVTPKRKPGTPLIPVNRTIRRSHFKRRGHRIDGTAGTQSPIIRRAGRRHWAKRAAQASKRGNR